MLKNLFSRYARLAKPEPLGAAKNFYVVPAASVLVPELANTFVVDEEGVVRVFTALETALANVVSNRGDVINVCMGSYAYTSTGISSAANGFVIRGAGPAGSVTISASAADTLTLTGDNWALENITLTSAGTFSSLVMTGCDNFDIKNCRFFTSGGGAGTYLIEMVTTANSIGKITNSSFTANLDVSAGAATVTALILGLGNRMNIEDCQFHARRQTTANAGAVTDGIVFANANDWGIVVKRCDFIEHNGATFTAGLEYGTNVTTGGVFPTMNNFLLGTAANAVVNGSNSAGFGNNMANGTV